MHLIESFVRNPVKVAVGVIMIAMFGTIALLRMPMQLTPEVETPSLTIETYWLGASPEEIESEIIQEQEEQLQGVEGLYKMTSECMDSMGRITLEFNVGVDLIEALVLVSSRLQQVREYPEDADEPVISMSNANNQFIAWFVLNARSATADEIAAFQQKHPELAGELEIARLASNPGRKLFHLRLAAEKHPEVRELLPPELNLPGLRRFAQDVIEARFEKVPGVSQSNVLGGREDELQVVVDSHRLAARMLTINDVRNALRGQNKDTSAGDFWEGKRRYVVRTMGKFRTIEQVENVILARRDDSPVYVKDVAEVRMGFKKPDGMVRRFGASVLAINAQRKTGANVLDVMDGLRKTMNDLNENVLRPRGLELSQVYDETEYIYSSINLVTDNVVEGGILSFIALLIFLRSFRSAVVIFVAIATSMIGMFLLLGLLGRSLNVLSLAGIAFAVGMLVDNFIVVMENIFRHRQSGDSIMAATVRGTKEVWGAVIAATLANLAVFIPVLFVEDQVGQLFFDLALAITCALAISLIVSLVVIPTAASRLLTTAAPRGEPALANANGEQMWERPRPKTIVHRRRSMQFRPRAWYQSVVAPLLAAILWPLDAFGRAFVSAVVGINAFLQRSVLLKIATVALFLIGSVYMSWLLMPPLEYLPTGNRNLVFGILLPPAGYNLEHMESMGTLIEAELRPYWDVEPGTPEASKLDAPAIADFFYVARGRQLFLGLRAADPLRVAELVPLVMRIGGKLPGVMLVAQQSSLFEQGLTAGRTIDVEITGPEVEKLVQIAAQGVNGKPGIMPAVSMAIPGAMAFPVPSLDLSSPEVHVVPRWERAADMGISAEELGYAVNALVDGAYATDYYIGSAKQNGGADGDDPNADFAYGGDKVDLSIVGEEDYASHSQDLRGLSIVTPQGSLVSLAAVADFTLEGGPEQINRRERQRAITVQVTPPPNVPLEAAMNTIRGIIEPIENDPSLAGLYQINLSGTADKLQTTWLSLRWNLLLAVVITYLVIAALFESWLYPFIIILSVPLGAVGGFLGLWLLNLYVLQPLDMLTMVGFIILIGTVVNNPILIVEQALVHMRDDDMQPRDAILESVRTRIRPIFMTALIGLVGLLPLVISPGAGSELYRGLGSVLLGGLIVSTMFTLVLVPTLFSLSLDIGHGLTRLFRGEQPKPPHRRAVDADETEAPAPHSPKEKQPAF